MFQNILECCRMLRNSLEHSRIYACEHCRMFWTVEIFRGCNFQPIQKMLRMVQNTITEHSKCSLNDLDVLELFFFYLKVLEQFKTFECFGLYLRIF